MGKRKSPSYVMDQGKPLALNRAARRKGDVRYLTPHVGAWPKLGEGQVPRAPKSKSELKREEYMKKVLGKNLEP